MAFADTSAGRSIVDSGRGTRPGAVTLSAVKRRVLGLKLAYDVRKAIYTHTLTLGAV